MAWIHKWIHHEFWHMISPYSSWSWSHAEFIFELISWIHVSFHDHEFMCYISWPMNSDMNSCLWRILWNRTWNHGYCGVPRFQMCLGTDSGLQTYQASLCAGSCLSIEGDFLMLSTWHCSTHSPLQRPGPPTGIVPTAAVPDWHAHALVHGTPAGPQRQSHAPIHSFPPLCWSPFPTPYFPNIIFARAQTWKLHKVQGGGGSLHGFRQNAKTN